MKKYIAYIAVVFCVGMALMILKLNSKINNLSVSVANLQSAEEKSQNQTQTDGYIPQLVPQKDGWMVTQFGNVMKNQEMCYTITTATGLVIVDGGWEYEEPRLRGIISQYGNCVEAWILTHPHSDHITAFMNIIQNPGDIQIHNIYTVEFPDISTLKENASWDDYSILEKFRNLKLPQVRYLHTGDSLDLMGLELEVLSAYSDEIDELSNDLLNDGSLMFRISGKRDSMLFCADVGSANKKNTPNDVMSQYLIDKYRDELKTDYIQMAHHGFGGLNEAFYRAVDPRAAFFDAPYWLMNGSDETKSSRKNEQLMQNMGKTVYSYYTAPNQILLE